MREMACDYVVGAAVLVRCPALNPNDTRSWRAPNVLGAGRGSSEAEVVVVRSRRCLIRLASIAGSSSASLTACAARNDFVSQSWS